MKERRYDIDWLRILATLAVFFFHCARFFGGGNWHLMDAEESITALLFIAWLDMFGMPLFCLLSGVGSWYALRSRTNGQYLWERVKRILVPLYTVGLFLLLPPQFYFEMFSNAGFRGSFWEILPRYISRLGNFSFAEPRGLVNVPFSGHMWFLQYLFLISLVALPLLRYLRSEKGLHLINSLAGWCNQRGGIFFFLIPVMLIRIGLRSVFTGNHTWADFFEFVVFFVVGYILPADGRFTDTIKKHSWVCLILGLAGFGGEGYFVLGLGYNYPGYEPFSLKFVLFETIMAISRLCWMIFVLSLGAKYLNFNNRIRTYGSKTVLPFYIFHQTIILCVGWFVIRWNIGILPKFLIIAVVSFAIIMLLYELLVRRLNVVRFFFGMRTKKNLSAMPTPNLEEIAA